jgi:hypothetical protein
MKVVLLLSQLFCLAALWRSPERRFYLCLGIYLSLAMLATLLFSLEAAYLQDWYAVAGIPVLFFRICCALEISYRQVEDFGGWVWIMTAAWCAAAAMTVAFSPTAVQPFDHPFIDARRVVQICQGGALLFFEIWWAAHAGWYRPRDWIAAAFTLSALSHGVVSLTAFGWGWTAEAWRWVSAVSWGADALAYLLLGVIFLSPEVVRRFLVHQVRFARWLFRGANPALPGGR